MSERDSIKGARIWIAGHRGLVGSALTRRLAREDCQLVSVDRNRLDLRRQQAVEDWMADARPDVVFLAASTVGGIHANSTRPAEFLCDNMLIEANVIDTAYRVGVSKLIFLGSSCIYPREPTLPIAESALLTGPLEPTNQWYAVAKIAGIKLCQAYRAQYGCDFISLMPTNLYGPGDNFDPAMGHVVPGLMGRLYDACRCGDETFDVWGTGTPRREFMHCDDFADAAVHLARHYSGAEHVNVGTGSEVSIRELVDILVRLTGFAGTVRFDPSRPDGTPSKLLDVSRLRDLGWSGARPLEEGLAETYRWFCENEGTVRGRETGNPKRGAFRRTAQARP